MKKTLSIIILVFALVGAYFLYDHFFWGKTMDISDVKKEQTITLTVAKGTPTSVRVLVTGHLDGTAKIRREPCDNPCDENVLKPGDVSLDFGQEWYDKNYVLKYEPVDVHSGNLQLRYIFYNVE